jgi:hypothetical protein
MKYEVPLVTATQKKSTNVRWSEVMTEETFTDTEQMFTITKKEYEYLLNRDRLLNCLERAGVDNWDGWDFAIDEYNEE